MHEWRAAKLEGNANVLGPCTAKVVQLLDYNGNEVLLRSYLDISLQNSYW